MDCSLCRSQCTGFWVMSIRGATCSTQRRRQLNSQFSRLLQIERCCQSAPIFSANLVRKPRMLLGPAIYVPRSLQLTNFRHQTDCLYESLTSDPIETNAMAEA